MKKIAMILVILSLFSIITGGILLVIKPKSNLKPKEVSYNFKNLEEIEMCVDKETCSIISPEFPILSYNTTNKETQRIVDEINKETKKYYKQVQESTMNDASCSEAKKVYKHSFLVHNDISIEKGKEEDKITVERILVNLCTNDYQYPPKKTYTIDKK